jgi:hypothetical protein
VDVAKTHETVHLESGMRSQIDIPRPDSCSESSFSRAIRTHSDC